MMFADCFVICSESKEHVEGKLESWRYALEIRGMKISRINTECMCVNERHDKDTVRKQREEVAKMDEFKYQGSTVHSNGGCRREVKKRLQAGCNGWRRILGVICDMKVPARVKGSVYMMVVRPIMLYGLETVFLAKSQEAKFDAG